MTLKVGGRRAELTHVTNAHTDGDTWIYCMAGCCARAASGHAAAAPPSAASNSRRPMVTVIRPSRARCVREAYHATSVQSSR